LVFDSAALDDLSWWIQQDRKKALRIIRLVQETASDPFGGIGKPEPLIYLVTDTTIRVLACRYHYE